MRAPWGGAWACTRAPWEAMGGGGDGGRMCQGPWAMGPTWAVARHGAMGCRNHCHTLQNIRLMPHVVQIVVNRSPLQGHKS